VALNRILKYFNIAILLALAVALLAVYWYAWRPLPQTSGTLRAPLAQNVTIERDALGVPHIAAANIDDALFAQGFVTAQDRLWQMDLLRRTAAGRLAEVAGSAALESDREARRLRLERLAERQAKTLPAADRAVLAAYASGVNYFIETNRGRLPVEFSLLGYDPRPWRIEDSLLVGLYMFRDLSSSWRNDLQKSELLASGDPAKVAFLFPLRAGGEIQPGSNAWALAGSRTASGRPLLSNDPHLEYSLPGIWYMVHLRAHGLNVSGAALPGVPCVILGHNERIAWGVTNMQADVQDLYEERLDPRTGQYVFENKIEQAQLEHETIPVKDSAPVDFAQWVTRHGPVLAAGNRFFALRWTAAETDAAFPFLDLDRSSNWQEFTAALARFPGPAQNFVYADTGGNIGYHGAGKVPIRRGWNGDVPVDGPSGKYEWDGYIPFDELPQSYNPPSGIVVSANQNPFPPDYPYRVNGNFAAPYRSSQIYALLAARKAWRPEEMLAIQKDVYSPLCHFLARELAAAYARRKIHDPALDEAIGILRSWNGQMERDKAAPLIATLVYQRLLISMAQRAAPRKAALYDPPTEAGLDSLHMAPFVVEKLLRERPKDWFPDYDQLLLGALLDAVGEGRRTQGHDLQRWEWGRYNELLLRNPVVGRIPFIGQYFDIGPVEQSGAGTTVKQTSRGLGPSMRMTVDLADLDRSSMNIIAGESGQPLSWHYKDQWEAYYTGRSFPMQFHRVDAKARLVLVPE
jgi:penicillin amidase